jgi:serine/threonine-protein kinase/endoribonuclease IRE1
MYRFLAFILIFFVPLVLRRSHVAHALQKESSRNRSNDVIIDDNHNSIQAPVSTATSTRTSSSLAVIEPVLVVTTLDGMIYAIGQRTGSIKWRIKDDPVVRVPQMPNASDPDQQKSRSDERQVKHQHLFLPDPKDGSLYMLHGVSQDSSDQLKDALTKMPFTISQLVSASPCRSSDGLLYTGNKIDSWITVNAKTGEKMEVMDSDSPVCRKLDNDYPEDKRHMETTPSFLFGRSLYHLSIFDARTREKKWNITLVDYSSTASGTFSSETTTSSPTSTYPFLHLTSSTTGKIVTIDLEAEEEDDQEVPSSRSDSNKNNVIWSLDLESPIIAMFEFDETGVKATKKVPFTTVGDPDIALSHNSVPSLYIGESPQTRQAYALSALVPFEMRLLSRKRNRPSLPLIEGPNEGVEKTKKKRLKRQHSRIEEYFQMLIYGYYEYPEYSRADFSSSLLLKQMEKNLLPAPAPTAQVGKMTRSTESVKLPFFGDESEEERLEQVYSSVIYFCSAIFFTAGIIVLDHFYTLKGNKGNTDVISVGKITYKSQDIIGRGSAGTCVYRGLFEGKTEIAVKRVIQEHFTLAQREIDLLRSLQHPNVVRYFTTESDNLFKYIAIELAELSLADWVEIKRRRLNLSSSSNDDQESTIDDDLVSLSEVYVLEEASKGLAHLHSINVIHRDIKPHNILISPKQSNKKNRMTRKIFISDFGVSKTLSSPSYSYEGASSMTNEFISTTRITKGTEGWIAPEVLMIKLGKSDSASNSETDASSDKKVMSKQIDIFSLGCLFCYVFTNGKHPFGDYLERQGNIIANKSDLSHLSKNEEDIAKLSLVKAMISPDPADRPRIQTVLLHPVFWSYAKQLQFLQDVSDRCEKEDRSSEVKRAIDTGKWDVVQHDWKRELPLEIQNELDGHRKYNSSSVDHLCRAIRNKRHHYRELSKEVKDILGDIPDGFMSYFNRKFPRLVTHCYIAMQVCKHEPMFKDYYDQDASWQFSYPRLPANQSASFPRASFASVSSFSPTPLNSSTSPAKKTKLTGSKARRKKGKNREARNKENSLVEGDRVAEEYESSSESGEAEEGETSSAFIQKSPQHSIQLKPQSMMFGNNWKSCQPPSKETSSKCSSPSKTSYPASPKKYP